MGGVFVAEAIHWDIVSVVRGSTVIAISASVASPCRQRSCSSFAANAHTAEACYSWRPCISCCPEISTSVHLHDDSILPAAQCLLLAAIVTSSGTSSPWHRLLVTVSPTTRSRPALCQCIFSMRAAWWTSPPKAHRLEALHCTCSEKWFDYCTYVSLMNALQYRSLAFHNYHDRCM